MENAPFQKMRAKILSDPELRKVYYESLKQRRAKAQEEAVNELERTEEQSERRKAFWAMLGYTPGDQNGKRQKSLLDMEPAEAWMFQHPEEVNAETAPTARAAFELFGRERLRLKATRRRLKEMGIR